MTTSDLFSGPDTSADALDFKALLNPAQYEAVTTTEGPILVVAGAGSGKTRTLVHRVAYLVQKGVTPESILLLTFTRKAAGEMLKRAGHLVGERSSRVSGGTFHALAHVILRRYAPRLGFPLTFGIMDRGDMEEVLGQIRKSTGLGDKDRKFPKRATLATIISKAANKGLIAEQLLAAEYAHLLSYAEAVKVLATEYKTFKQENALLDFDDLLIQLNRLLDEDPEARDEIAARYQYIMIDEYQDTNPVQADIVHHLGRGHGNVMAVGDDAQAIYSFRGASFRNIMEFPDRFPGARIIRLEENYRSRQPILDLTNHIISQAREKYEKKLFTRKQGGPRPHLATVSSQVDQALFVCGKILELQAEGVPLSQIAVLFRAARHSFKLEMELTRRNLDYVKYGGRRFLEAAHIKDLLAFLRTVANPKDGVSLTRTLLLMDGIGPKSAGRIASWVEGKRARLAALGDYPAKGKTKEGLAPLAALYTRLAPKGLAMNERIEETWNFYRPLMEAKFDDHPSREADIKEFLSLAQGYSSLKRFLSDMALEPPNASFSAGRPLDDRLTLSTVHSAKGLEWEAVFIIEAVEGRFPPIYSNTPEDLDEERRLMYVAATRAKDRLFLICPLEYSFENGVPKRPRVSRFLEDIPPNLLDSGGEASRPANRVLPSKSPVHFTFSDIDEETSPEKSGDPETGDRVTHPVFGLGRVLEKPGGRRARVDFDHFGVKTLHLDYAGLKRVP